MPALNYQSRFAPLVESGAKRSTIRARRKDGRDPKPGQTLYHFTGMRTKKCRRLGETVCARVSQIKIRQYLHSFRITGSGRHVSQSTLGKLWSNEGFDSLGDMLHWFRKTHGLPFTGLLIEW